MLLNGYEVIESQLTATPQEANRVQSRRLNPATHSTIGDALTRYRADYGPDAAIAMGERR